MKKFATALALIDSKDIVIKVAELKKDIADLTRGVRMGDVQNYKMVNVKKKELARLLTRKSKEEKGDLK